MSVAGLRGADPLRLAGNSARMALAMRPALRAIHDFRPQVMFTTGGYVSAPVVMAARLRRVPVLLLSCDVSAGLAIQTEARFASRIAVPVPEARANLPAERTVVTGYPVRPEMLDLPAKAEAKRRMGFNARRRLLLVFGGSLGAHTLNETVHAGRDQLLPRTQVLHVAGAEDAPTLAAQPGYRVEVYMDDLPLAMAAADLAICRSGASTLGELPAAGLPAILVPGPFAGGHQRFNAQVLARAGGATILANSRVAEDLVPAALALLEDRPRLKHMSAAMRAQFRPDAARTIAQELVELAA